jgi:class 3 adenylate cyclase
VSADPAGSLLERARDAADERRWPDAEDLLTQADRGATLEPDDLELLGRAAYLTGHPDVALGAWERVYGARMTAGDPRGAADAALHVCELHLDAGSLAALHRWLRRAEDLLSDLPESPAHGSYATLIGFASFLVGDADAALAWGRRAAEIGTNLGDAASRVVGRNVEGRALILQGLVEEGLAIIDETTIAAVSGELDPFSAAIVFCSSVCASQSIADLERAEEWTKEMERWCRRNEVGSFHGWCRVHGAEIRRLRGRLAEAESEALHALEEVRTYVRLERGWPLYEIGTIRMRLGDLAGAERAFLEANELGWEPQPGLALLRLAQGDVASAAAEIRDAVEHPSGVQSWERPPNTDIQMAPVFEAQVEIAIADGDLARARAAADELERIAGALGIDSFRASAAVSRARVRLAGGDATEAEAGFRTGADLWSKLGAPYENARARVGLATASRAMGSDERALLELAGARSTFERIGAKRDARTAAALAEEIRPSRKEAPREHRAFVFTDIVRSTDLVELIGDEAWGHLVRWHHATLGELIGEHHGEVVRTTGDGIFVTFGDPRDAIGCAVAIQRALREHRTEHGFSPRVRIGAHAAEATREGDDWSGVEVHAAARIGALAEADEILVSKETAEGAPFEVSEPRSVSLKGIARPLEVVSVSWR